MGRPANVVKAIVHSLGARASRPQLSAKREEVASSKLDSLKRYAGGTPALPGKKLRMEFDNTLLARGVYLRRGTSIVKRLCLIIASLIAVVPVPFAQRSVTRASLANTS